MLRITSAKVAASPGKTEWVQIHGFTPGEPEKIKSRGQLFVVVSSKNGKEGIEAISFEREIVGRFREEYYESSLEKTFDALRSATQKVMLEFGSNETKIEIACCAYADGIIYTSAVNGGRVVIQRNGGLASILESTTDVIVASGFPKDGDTIVIGTKAFFEKVSIEELKKSLVGGNPESATESLTPLIYGGNEDGTAGGMVIKFEEAAEFVGAEESTGVSNLAPPAMFKPKINLSGEKISTFFRGLASRIPKRNIYIKPGFQDEAVSQSRKLTLSVGIILLAVLAVSVGFGIRQKKANSLKKEYQALLMEASGEIDQAINLAGVNPDESRQLFLDSEQKLTQIKALKVKDPDVEELQKKIADSRAAVLGEYSVEPELFLDLGLLASGFKGDLVSSSGGNIYVLDKNGNRVVSITLDTKKSKVVANPSVIENAQDLASYEENVYVLMPDGIYLVGSKKTKVIDKTWSGEAFIHSFAGNLYVLDKSGNVIYRYSGQSGNTFGSQQNWLSASTKADFSNSISWGMNGAIYVLYPNSKILKYSLGSTQNFSITGASPEIGNVDSFYIDPNNQYIYLLDKTGKRVIALDKNGKYKAQYIGDQIAAATKLVVSEAEGKIILLTGEKLLSIDLKGI